MKEHKVLEALEALAENDRLSGVPPSVEMRLIQAFRARRPKRAFPSWAAVCSIAAAAGLLTVVTVQHRPWHIPTPKPFAEVGRTEKAVAVAITETPKAAAHPMRPIMPKRPPNPARIEEQNATRQEQNATEMVTDFFPLIDPAPPFDRGEILRVQLPATAMRAVGLPVSEDHLADQVQADVLVGEEGLPRAIRFVKYEMK